jgi:hypothetical protein
MVEFSTREKSMVLVFVTKWLSKWHRGNFEASEILNLAEWMLWRIDKARDNIFEFKFGGKEETGEYEFTLLRGMISLDEYVCCVIQKRNKERLHEIADEWYGMKECGKYFGDF